MKKNTRDKLTKVLVYIMLAALVLGLLPAIFL
ncbi:MAG: DUF4044 domain-containing protein [Clostridium sp.]|nr:DUF4044 domain-containing protein [Clostridium sp.]MDY5098148.1 DUF4044 domain-containing protein [Clostridium sp.]